MKIILKKIIKKCIINYLIKEFLTTPRIILKNISQMIKFNDCFLISHNKEKNRNMFA